MCDCQHGCSSSYGKVALRSHLCTFASKNSQASNYHPCNKRRVLLGSYKPAKVRLRQSWIQHPCLRPTQSPKARGPRLPLNRLISLQAPSAAVSKDKKYRCFGSEGKQFTLWRVIGPLCYIERRARRNSRDFCSEINRTLDLFHGERSSFFHYVNF